VFLAVGRPAPAAAPELAPGDKEPFLRLEPGGHMAYVTALAFSPDGRTLYSASHDKVVRVWRRAAGDGFALDPKAYRVPIGPGQDGILNALAVSADGTWLAVGGMGAMRDVAGLRESGIYVPLGGLTPDMRRDRGMIFLFNTRTGAVRLLREHQGAVLALAFAPPSPGKHTLLVSAAREWIAKNKEYKGVVRLWDVDEDKYVDGVVLDDPKMRPGLAVRHTGKGSKELRIAIAWGDGHFRVWDVERDQLHEAQDLQLNTTVAYLPREQQFLTGGLVRPDGFLRRWDDPDQGAPTIDAGAGQYNFRSGEQGVYLFPQALYLASSKEDGNPESAAVVLARGTIANKTVQIEGFRVGTVDLARPGVVSKHIPLRGWSGDYMPAVAAAAGGQYLAVAGDESHTVRLYALPLNAEARPQLLRGLGTPLRQVAFATNNKKELGLVLSETAREDAGKALQTIVEKDRVFHFGQRNLIAKPRGWQPAGPDLGDWHVEYTPRQMGAKGTVLAPATFWVGKGDAGKPQLTLSPAEKVSDYALLPPRAPLNIPILALATWDDETMEPLLFLYNAATGERLRQLKGHVEPIRALAFSPDGRLLASVADDQVASVWTLTNLDKVVGRRGLVRGLAVKDNADGGVIVNRILRDSPARGKLDVGDVIEGIVLPADKLQHVKSAHAFYQAVWPRKPGDALRLRVKGKGDVVLRVGQGTDEQKPLFSLFVTAGEAGQGGDWIGWNSVGPYDASGANAEQYLGWHFNTGNPKEPTTFAGAGQYRKQYYREGILGDLVVAGNLVDALKAWKARQPPPPRPVMNPWIDEIGPDPKLRDGRGRVVVRRLPITLKLAIYNIYADEIESVKWQIDQGALQDFDKTAQGERTADLSKLKWARGDHRVRIVVVTKEDRQEYGEDLVVRYLPAPPVVKLDGAALKPYGDPQLPAPGKPQFVRLVVKPDDAFQLKAEVIPNAEVSTATVTLRRADKTLKKWPLKDKLAIAEKIDLEPGESVLELRAGNDDAQPGDEEADSWTLVVFKEAKVENPPQILLEKVGKADVKPEESVLVHEPKVVVSGRIKASAALTEAKWNDKALRDFKAGETVIRFEEELPLLKPGKNQFTFTAQTEKTKATPALLSVVYQPQLPKLVLNGAVPGLELIEGEQEQEVEVHGVLTPPADAAAKYQAVLLVNGDKLRDLATPLAEKVALKVALQPGVNDIQVRFSNDQDQVFTTEKLRVVYRRPPRNLVIVEPTVEAGKVLVVKEPMLRLLAQVDSPEGLPLTRVEVGDRQLSTGDLKAGVPQAGMTRWTMEVRKLTLREGLNEMAIRTWNKDGENRKKMVLQVRFEPPKVVSPPRVEFLDPKRDATVQDTPYRIKFSIQSADPLVGVELTRSGKPYRLEVAKLLNARGTMEMEVPVDLLLGVNALKLVATNAGGPGEAQVSLNLIRKPVRVVFDRLVIGNKEIEPKAIDGKIVFPKVDQSNVRVRGRMIWPDGDDKQLTAPQDVQVWVNGSKQPPAELKKRVGQGLEREFEAVLILNQSNQNQVEVEVPGLPQEGGVRREFLVDCAHPAEPDTMHVLVVGVGEKDDKKLEARVRQALQAQPDGEQWKNKQFKIKLYGPLTEYVSPEKVYAQLNLIKKTIDTRAAKGGANDVLLVYYVGTESIQREGHFLLTDVSKDDPELRRSAISVDKLREGFMLDALGAKVLLFDLVREDAAKEKAKPADQMADYPDVARISLLRYSWQGGARLPAEPRLITSFDQALRRDVELGKVAKDIDEMSSSESKVHPQLEHYRHIPPGAMRLLLQGP
jgi:WD40 repeat protein